MKRRKTQNPEVAGLTPGCPTGESGQVVHIHVPLSPSSIIWYWPNDSDALWLRLPTDWNQLWLQVRNYLYLFKKLLLTGIIDLLAEEPLRVHTASSRHLATTCVHTPAVVPCRVALLRTEFAVIHALRHVRCWIMLLTCINLLPMTLTQKANST